MATIALVNPPAPMNITRRWRCAVEQGHYLFPPIELCYLASCLKKAGHQVALYDCVADQMPGEVLSEKLATLQPDAVLAIPGYEHINDDIETMSLITPQGTPLAIFGHLASIYAIDLLKNHNRLDFVILGEPEITAVELCEHLTAKDKSSILGLAWKDANGTPTKNHDRPDIANLDELPMPDRSFIDHSKYSSGFSDPVPFTTMISARGCSYRCTYCVRSYGDVLRMRSVPNVMEELKAISALGIKSVRFLDDTFTARREWVEEFARQYKANRLTIKWTCLARPDNLDEALIADMASAGCTRIMMGVEAGNKKILASYARNPASINHLPDLCKAMRRHGIQSFAFFLIGGPEEDMNQMKESLALAKRSNPDFITLNMMRAYPGTSMYDRMAKTGGAGFSIYPYSSSFKSKLPDEEVHKFLFTFYRNFYFSPKWIVTHIPMMVKNFKYMMKLGREYLSWEVRGTNFGAKKGESRVVKSGGILSEKPVAPTIESI